MLADAFESSFISGTGPYVERSQMQLQEFTGARHALLTCNGTASLHLALMALNIKPGDEVIVPSFTYISSVNAILYVGAIPVFVDVDQTSWTLDPEEVAMAVSPQTRAIMAVHLYGHPFDFVQLRRVADEHGLFLVEDAAEAHFSTSQGHRVGNLGDISSFSFFGNKVLTSGEGGAVTTNSSDLFEKMSILRNQGMDPHRRFFHPMVGNNFRMNNLSAAVLSAQLERADELRSKRNAIFDFYDHELLELEEVTRRPVSHWATMTPWLYSVLLNPKLRLRIPDMMRHLQESEVETRPFFTPAHLMPPYEDFPRSSGLRRGIEISVSGFNLPTSSLMKKADVSFVVKALKAAIHKFS